jgi:hypothetical protein
MTAGRGLAKLGAQYDDPPDDDDEILDVLPDFSDRTRSQHFCARIRGSELRKCLVSGPTSTVPLGRVIKVGYQRPPPIPWLFCSICAGSRFNSGPLIHGEMAAMANQNCQFFDASHHVLQTVPSLPVINRSR